MDEEEALYIFTKRVVEALRGVGFEIYFQDIYSRRVMGGYQASFEFGGQPSEMTMTTYSVYSDDLATYATAAIGIKDRLAIRGIHPENAQ